MFRPYRCVLVISMVEKDTNLLFGKTFEVHLIWISLFTEL